jgi:hypothetical protein
VSRVGSRGLRPGDRVVDLVEGSDGDFITGVEQRDGYLVSIQ